MKQIICIGMMVMGLCIQSMAKDTGYLGYGGPFIKMTTIDNNDVIQYGVYGGELYGDVIVGGLAAVGETFSHTGMYFGYRFDGFNQVSIVPNITLGYGYYSEDDTKFGLIDPGVNIEFSLSEHKKLFAGVNYRMTNHADDMDGASIIAGIKFGTF